MFRRKAFLHWYTGEGEFVKGQDFLDIQDYLYDFLKGDFVGMHFRTGIVNLLLIIGSNHYLIHHDYYEVFNLFNTTFIPMSHFF